MAADANGDNHIQQKIDYYLQIDYSNCHYDDYPFIDFLCDPAFWPRRLAKSIWPNFTENFLASDFRITLLANSEERSSRLPGRVACRSPFCIVRQLRGPGDFKSAISLNRNLFGTFFIRGLVKNFKLIKRSLNAGAHGDARRPKAHPKRSHCIGTKTLRESIIFAFRIGQNLAPTFPGRSCFIY